ncbi:hypothetical protein ALP29_201087 [Pseudomonas syringae pv. avii]|uniref:Uncharacterized protein n=1 Tax=Pseudomonas syringae pv. avii TaxID=663959 RepID=A0A3M5UV67_PSESX|nr:hypothetical protein ALP29_201087 [Pseudomonas syringae pv. avii]
MECKAFLDQSLPITGYFAGQQGVLAQLRQLFAKLWNVAVKHDVVHVHKTQRAIFFGALIKGQQHATTSHGLEILDHVFAHTDIGTDEKADAVEGVAILFPGFGARDEQVLDLAQLIEQCLAAAVGHTVGAAHKGQFDIALAGLQLQQAMVIAFGHEHRIKAFFAQAFADHEARTDHPRPGQLAIVRAELAGVLAGDVVLVGIVFKDDQIGNRADEPDLTDFLLEAQKKHDPVITLDIHFTAEIATQVALLIGAQPTHLALTIRGDAFIKTVENGPLLFLDQK